jgi:hypothetical protein
MKQIAKFQKGQRVGGYNSPRSQHIYEVDEVAESGSTWTASLKIPCLLLLATAVMFDTNKTNAGYLWFKLTSCTILN